MSEVLKLKVTGQIKAEPGIEGNLFETSITTSTSTQDMFSEFSTWTRMYDSSPSPGPRPPSRCSQKQQRPKTEPLVKIEEFSEVKEEKRSNEILSIGPSFVNLQAAPDSDYDEIGKVALGDDPLVADDEEELEKEYAEDLTLKWTTTRRPGVRPYDTFLGNNIGSASWSTMARNIFPVRLDKDGLPILEAGDASEDDSDSETEAATSVPTTEAEKAAAELAKRTCNLCGVVLSRKFDIPRHLKDTHNDGTAITNCMYCNKTFKRPDRYSKHLAKMVNGVCGSKGRGKQQVIDFMKETSGGQGTLTPNLQFGGDRGTTLSYRPTRVRVKKVKDESRDGVKKAPRKSTNGTALKSRAMTRATISIPANQISGVPMCSTFNPARPQFSSPQGAFQPTFYNTAPSPFSHMVPPTPTQGIMPPTDNQTLYHHDNHAFAYTPESPASMGQSMLSLSSTPSSTPPMPGYEFNDAPQQYFQQPTYCTLPLVPGNRSYPGPHLTW